MNFMSSPQLRRQDRVLGEADTRQLIAQAYCGRLATVGKDGWPYLEPRPGPLADQGSTNRDIDSDSGDRNNHYARWSWF